MVSLLAVLGRHRTLLTSTDSIYSGPTPNHNTSTMQDALLDRGLVLYSVGGEVCTRKTAMESLGGRVLT